MYYIILKWVFRAGPGSVRKAAHARPSPLGYSGLGYGPPRVLWAKVFEGSFCHLPAGPLLPCTGKKRQNGKSNIIKKHAQNHPHNRWWIILNEIVLKWVNLVYFNYINYHIW